MFGDECVCVMCGRRYIHDFRKGHTRRWCNSCRNTRWRDRRALKQRMVDYKGGACQVCAYRRCLRALDFHHLDPATKRFTVANAHQRSWKSLCLELDKCILVCSNCHLELEAKSGQRGRPRREDPEGTSTCDRCRRRFMYRPRKGMTRNRCNSCCQPRDMPEARRRLKLWMVEYKGGGCQVCGYDRHWAALTFHHIDPRLKRFNLAQAHKRSADVLRDELDRCVLVCANCHDEIEDGTTLVPAGIAAAFRAQTDHLPRLERRPPGRPRHS